MCFRPSVASKNVACPGCGKKLTIQPGATPKKCPFCNADFPQEHQVQNIERTDKDKGQ